MRKARARHGDSRREAYMLPLNDFRGHGAGIGAWSMVWRADDGKRKPTMTSLDAIVARTLSAAYALAENEVVRDQCVGDHRYVFPSACSAGLPNASRVDTSHSAWISLNVRLIINSRQDQDYDPIISSTSPCLTSGTISSPTRLVSPADHPTTVFLLLLKK